MQLHRSLPGFWLTFPALWAIFLVPTQAGSHTYSVCGFPSTSVRGYSPKLRKIGPAVDAERDRSLLGLAMKPPPLPTADGPTKVRAIPDVNLTTHATHQALTSLS